MRNEHDGIAASHVAGPTYVNANGKHCVKAVVKAGENWNDVPTKKIRNVKAGD